ncbi:unnamed protein product [Cuscuta epithymum]|uniref:Uncharacterized protein n=1 Tax=Cuscuta epithymum TaxID=186058 RepID=A0AAV0CJ84_9ASTE|nr:unnamed protein product [Cuscuta epithymum]
MFQCDLGDGGGGYKTMSSKMGQVPDKMIETLLHSSSQICYGYPILTPFPTPYKYPPKNLPPLPHLPSPLSPFHLPLFQPAPLPFISLSFPSINPPCLVPANTQAPPVGSRKTQPDTTQTPVRRQAPATPSGSDKVAGAKI